MKYHDEHGNPRPYGWDLCGQLREYEEKEWPLPMFLLGIAQGGSHAADECENDGENEIVEAIVDAAMHGDYYPLGNTSDRTWASI